MATTPTIFDDILKSAPDAPKPKASAPAPPSPAPSSAPPPSNIFDDILNSAPPAPTAPAKSKLADQLGNTLKSLAPATPPRPIPGTELLGGAPPPPAKAPLPAMPERTPSAIEMSMGGMAGGAGIPPSEQIKPGEFTKGVATGKQMFGGSLQFLGALTRLDPLRKWGEKLAESTPEQRAKWQPRVAELKDIKTPDDALDWLSFTLGNLVPSMGASITGGVAGGAAGSAAGGPVGAFVGGAAGAGGISYLLNGGEVYANLIEKGVPRDRARNAAAAAGVPMALLDMIEPVKIAGKLVWRPIQQEATEKLAKATLKELAKDTLLEGATEGAQEAIGAFTEHRQTGKPFLTPETGARLLNAVAAGMAGGLVFGGVGEAGAAARRSQDPRTTPSGPSNFREAFDRIYRAFGSPEIKFGGKFSEQRPFSSMSDAELVAHANSIEQDPPRNYEWQRAQIVQEILRRQSGRQLDAGSGPFSPGSSFPTESGSVEVTAINPDGSVTYDQTLSTGSILRGQRLPLDRFQGLVSPAPPRPATPEPAAPTPQAVPPAVEPAAAPTAVRDAQMAAELDDEIAAIAREQGGGANIFDDILAQAPTSAAPLPEQQQPVEPTSPGQVPQAVTTQSPSTTPSSKSSEVVESPVPGATTQLAPSNEGGKQEVPPAAPREGVVQPQTAGADAAGAQGAPSGEAAPQASKPTAVPAPTQPNLRQLREQSARDGWKYNYELPEGDTVTVYRGLRGDAPAEIRPNDWITLDRETALRVADGDDSKIVSAALPADEIVAMNPIVNEWAYVPGWKSDPKQDAKPKASGRQYSSTQVNLPSTTADAVRQYGASIPEESLTPDGREGNPHITVRYGNDEADAARIARALEGQGPIKAKLKALSIFPNVDTEHGKADVLKFDIDSADLRRLNKLIGDAVPHPGETFPDYKPHVTVAYLKPGEGKKWAGKGVQGISGQTVEFDAITFSGKDGKETTIPLAGKPAEKAPPTDVVTALRGALQSLKDGKLTTAADFSKVDLLLSRGDKQIDKLGDAAPEDLIRLVQSVDKALREAKGRPQQKIPGETPTAKAPTLVETPATPVEEEKPAPPGPIPSGPWMNRMDIEEALERVRYRDASGNAKVIRTSEHPVLARATKFLRELQEETDKHSDGWPYWKAPAHAAMQLMGMIQNPQYATEANFRKALAPIKSFYNKRGNAAGMRWPNVDGVEKYIPVTANRPDAPAKAPKPTPKQRAEAETARRRDLFQVGNVLKTSSGYEKVLAYEEGTDSFGTKDPSAWKVSVITTDEAGNPKPNERQRTHQTPPDAKTTVVSRAEKEPTAKPPDNIRPESKPLVERRDVKRVEKNGQLSISIEYKDPETGEYLGAGMNTPSAFWQTDKRPYISVIVANGQKHRQAELEEAIGADFERYMEEKAPENLQQLKDQVAAAFAPTETSPAPAAPEKPADPAPDKALANKAISGSIDELIDASDRGSRSTTQGPVMAEMEATRLRQRIQNAREVLDSPLGKGADQKQRAALTRTIELAEKVLETLEAAAKPAPATTPATPPAVVEDTQPPAAETTTSVGEKGEEKAPEPAPPADLASALGFSADDIVKAAAAEIRGQQQPAAAPQRPTPPPPRTRGIDSDTALRRAGLTPSSTPIAKPANPLAGAADAAEADFLAKWGKKKGPSPLQSRSASPIEQDDLKNLTVMGARRILDGATDYQEWAQAMQEGPIGGALEAMADYVGMTSAEVLRQIHQLSAAVARQFGVEASTPPAEQSPTINTEEQPDVLTEPAAAADEPVSAADNDPLAEQLPEGDGGAGEGRPAPGGRRARGRRRGPDSGAGAREGELEPGAGDVSGVVGDPAAPERTFPPRAKDVVSTRHDRDYRIPDGRVVSGSPESRARTNIAAIRTLRQIQKENRPATVAEMDVLAGYVGWGAVPQLFAGKTPEWQQFQNELKSLLSDEEYASAQRSTTNAHYTGDQHVDAMWNALVKMGAKPGMSWLEPAIGVGNFFGRQPAALLEGARRMGIDKDSISGQIATLLYPDSGISIMGFEESELPPDYFDGIVSNVPFGDFGVHDPAFRGKPFLTSSIHNYYFAKALNLVRPGGVVAFITSRYTMDGYSASHKALRSWINDRADFLGAVRLPAGAFRQNAGTEVITDIIFLRKRLPGADAAGADWLESNHKHLKHEKAGYWEVPTAIAVNEYYHANPDMVLGTEGLSRGQFSANDYNVKGSLTQEQLEAALGKVAEKGGFQEFQPGAKRSRSVAVRELNAPDAITSKIGGLFFDEKGNLFRRTSKGAAEPVDVPAPMRGRIKAQLIVRDTLRNLLDAELADKPESDLKALRANLNAAYDAFVRNFGYLSSQANIKALDGDPDAPLLLSLERKYDKGNKAKGRQPSAEKAPIFERRMLRPPERPTSVGDPKEALYITLNEKGRLDWERMTELTGLSEKQLQSDLQGLVYLDPESRTWQTAEEYLSGSVRNKLKLARAIAQVEPQFQPNVEALEKVQPQDIPPGEIRALLGVTWVPIDVYSQFAAEMLGAEKADAVKVRYAGGEWGVDTGYTRFTNIQKWSTARASAVELLRDTLNMRRTKIYDRDSDGKTFINPDETKAARARQMEIQDHFEKWLFSDPKRGDQLVRIYNDLHNDLRLRTYDGAHLTLPGMTRDAAVVRGGDLAPHQKAAVWRQIVQPNVMLAHAVGAGKTFEMIAAGMELKRLGLIQRPMYVVPNATLTGWQEQFTALYPDKRVLVFSEKDLERSNRQKVMAQIATGDWDAVVVPHSSFQLLPTGDEIFEKHYDQLAAELEESIHEAEAAGIDSRQIKRMEKAKERLLTSLKEKRGDDKKDRTVSWEQLGIDQLFVDESHEYKKLGFSTKQGNVAGIDQEGNQRTFDLLMKLRYTQHHGRGVVFATGTPVTNTMGELFSIMRYLIEPEIKARGLGKFDEWAANYGRTVDVFEPKIEGGGYQLKARFAQFVNLPELAQLFRSFADVVTSDMIDIPRPTLAGGARKPVEQQLTDFQRQIMEEDLQPRAKAIRANPKQAMPDNMLAVYTDAQKMALDPRMLVPSAADHPGSRLNMAADLIFKHYKESAANRGTQLVLSDLGKPAEAGGSAEFSVYDDLIDKLVKRGIPRHEIAHIYQAKNKAQRSRLFQDVNDGKVRILLGSTMKMGVGVNVQKRLYALHHLDVPHRPSDLEQREGRILRQGNENPEVHIYYYVTKGSLDEAKFANVVRKAKFISQVMQGKSTVREAEDVGGMIPSLEMFQAMASGDPRVMRKMEVDAEVDRLSGVYSGWRNQQYRIRADIGSAQWHINHYGKLAGQITQEIATRDETGDVWEIARGKHREITAIDAEKPGKEVNERMAAAVLDIDRRKAKEKELVGYAAGLPIYLELYPGIDSIRVKVGEFNSFDLVMGADESNQKTDYYRRISNIVNGLEDDRLRMEGNQERYRGEIKNLEDALQENWPYLDQLNALIAEQQQLIKDLGATKGDDAAAAVDESGEVTDARVEAQDQEDVDDGSAEDDDEGDDDGGPKPPKPPKKPPVKQEIETFRGNDPVRLAGALLPISYAPKARINSVWNGNLASKTGAFVTDGSAAIPVDSIADPDVKRQLGDKKQIVRVVEDSAIEKLYDAAVEGATIPLETLGYARVMVINAKKDTPPSEVVYFAGAGKVFSVDAEYLSVVQRAIGGGADIFGDPTNVEKAIVFKRDGKALAILMPLKPTVIPRPALDSVRRPGGGQGPQPLQARRRIPDDAERGAWVAPDGKVSRLSRQEHEHFAREVVEKDGPLDPENPIYGQPATTQLLDKGWMRIRGYALETTVAQLKAGPTESLINAVKEAFRGGDGGSILVETAFRRQYAWVTKEEAPEFLRDPWRFVQKYMRDNGLTKPGQEALQSRRPMPGMYSALERALDAKMPERATPAQVGAIIANPQNGVKPDEVKWSGFGEWLAQQKGPVTKAEALEFIRANQVQVEEVTRGGDPEIDRQRAMLEQQDRDLELEWDDLNSNGDDMPTNEEIADVVGWTPNDPRNRMEEIEEERAEIQRKLDSLEQGKPIDWNKQRDGYWTAKAPSAELELWFNPDSETYFVTDVSADRSVGEFRTMREAKDAAQEQFGRGAPLPTKYGQWVLGGTGAGQNYRELLLTLPVSHKGADVRQLSDGSWRVVSEGGSASFGATREEALARHASQQKNISAYTSSHWDEPNVLAHVRFDDRTGANGEKILHVAEIQSDWHQEGRKKGYVNPGGTEKWHDIAAAGESYLSSIGMGLSPYNLEWVFVNGGVGQPQQKRIAALTEKFGAAWVERARELSGHADLERRGVPAAPFQKTWHELAFRRMLRYAAENGYDKLTWDTGETAAERFDISKQVSRVELRLPKEVTRISKDGSATSIDPKEKGYDLKAFGLDGEAAISERNIPEQKIADYVGKEVAEKLLTGENAARLESGQPAVLEGLDLKVGGEGMKGFYDQILPAYAAKYGKKWGAKVGTTEVPSGVRGGPAPGMEARVNSLSVDELLTAAEYLNLPEESEYSEVRAAIREHIFDGGTLEEMGISSPAPRSATEKVHSIDITPAMRQSVMQGQPLFARGAATSAPATDTNGIPTLAESPAPAGDFPSLKEIKAYWGAAVAQPTTIDGVPVLFVNGSAMDIILARMGMTGADRNSTEVLGLALTAGEWLNVVEEARVAGRNPRPGGFDDALARIGGQLAKLAGIEDGQRLYGAAAKRGPVVVVQAGDSIRRDAIRPILEEELDHAKQIQLPRGMRGLPVDEMLDSPAGRKAAAALQRFGYVNPDPRDPFYNHNRAIMAAEIGARLMRGGRYQELGLTPDEAVELAATYIEGLERMHGEKALEIVEQTNNALTEYRASLRGRSQNLDGEYQDGAPGAPQGRTEGAPKLPPRTEPAGPEPAANRRREIAQRPVQQKPKFADWIDFQTFNLSPPQLVGLCRRIALDMARTFPELEPVRGSVRLADGSLQPGHWWTVDRRGGVVDPTARQFDSEPKLYYPDSIQPALQPLREFLYSEAGESNVIEAFNRLLGRARPKVEEGAVYSPRPTAYRGLMDFLKPVKQRIAEQGKAGAVLQKFLERTKDEGELDAAGRILRLIDAGLMELTREQRFQLLDVLEGRADADDPKVEAAFNAVREITDELGAEAKAAKVMVRVNRILGPDDIIPAEVELTDEQKERLGRGQRIKVSYMRKFQPLANYFPHVIPSTDALKSGKIRRDVIENLVRLEIASSPDAAAGMIDSYRAWVDTGKRSAELEQYLVESGQAEDTDQAFALLMKMRQRHIRREGSLEYSRDANLPFYDPDPARVMPPWVHGESIRLNQIRVFGQDDQRVTQLIHLIEQNGGDGEFVRAMVDKILGKVNEPNRSEAKLSRALRVIQGFKLGLAAIPNVTQGALNTLLYSKDLSLLWEGAKGVATKEGRRLGLESGAAIEGVLEEMVRYTAGEGEALSTFLRAVGFTATERANRVFAANAGAAWAGKLLRDLQRNPLDSKSFARARLLDLGLNPDRLLEQGRLTPRDILMAAKKMSDITQFRSGMEDLPAFTAGPWGKVLFQFKNYIYNQTRLLDDAVRGEIKDGRPGSALRAMLILAIVFPMAGEAIADLRDLIKGKPIGDRPKGLRRWWDDIAQAGTLGLLQDMFQAASYGRLGDWLLGPTGGEVVETGENIWKGLTDAVPALRRSKTGQHRKPADWHFHALMRQGFRRIPIFGPRIADYIDRRRGVQRRSAGN